MNLELGFLGVIAGIGMLCVVVFMVRHERDAYLGRALRKAAGTEHGARMAIESANLDRLLEQKFTGELVKARKPQSNRLPANVTRLVPRIPRRVRSAHFEPPSAA